MIKKFFIYSLILCLAFSDGFLLRVLIDKQEIPEQESDLKFGAPLSNLYRSVIPETGSKYYVGTTTAVFKGGHFDEICLLADCRTTWPGGSSANLIYRLIGSSNYYSASSSATDNLVWHFNNGFISNASSSFRGTLNASSTQRTTGLATFFDGLISSASSTFANSLQIGGYFNASSTANFGSLSLFNGALISFGSTTLTSNLNLGGVLNASSTFAFGGSATSTLAGPLSSASGNQIIAGDTLLLNPYGLRTHIASATPTSIFNANGGLTISTTTFFGNNLSIGSTTPAARFSLQFTGSELPLLIGTSTGSSTFLINNSGNVGIGTTTPNQKLAVQGRVEALSFGGTAQSATSSIAGGLTARNLQLNGYAAPAIVVRNFFYASTTGPDMIPLGPLFPQAFTVTDVKTRITCFATSSPASASCGGGVNFQIYHGASQNSTTTLFSNNLQNVNSTNTAQTFTNFNDSTFAADEEVFFHINSASSSITVPQHGISVSIRGYYDP